MSIPDVNRCAGALAVRRFALGAFLGLVLTIPGCRAAPQSSLTALPIRPADLEMSLGAADDPVLAFSRIVGLTVDRDDRIYVMQSTEPVITVLNADGTLHERFGGMGEGPGEFRSPNAFGWWGDTLWVADIFQRRVSWFYQGQHLRTSRFAPVRLDRSAMPGAAIAAQWPLADGSHLTLVSWRFTRPAGSPENYFPIIRTTTDEGPETIVARLQESFPFGLVIDIPNGRSYGSPLFRDFPLQSMGEHGERLAIVERPFSSGPQVPIRLTLLDARGDTVYSRGYMVDVEQLTDEQWDARLQEAIARVNRPGRPAPGWGLRELEEASRRPAHWPSVSGMFLGTDSSVWIGLADLPWRADRDWAVLDSRGTPLFKVSLPRGFHPSVASSDLIWGVWNDELDVPHVQRYQLGGVDR